MSPLLSLLAGLGCLAMGLGYLYRPDVIERLYTFLREYVLNDSHLALERKKWGAFFLLIGFLFIYLGWTGLP